MTRLASLEKAGFYPTPSSRLDDILSVLRVDEDGHFRLFDPCCGKGEALAYLAHALEIRYPTSRFTTWGVEISGRAAEAKKVLNNVVQAPFESTVSSPIKCKSLVSFVLLNPPYQKDANGQRMELTFLQRTLAWMPKGSILAYIIPWDQLTWTVSQTLTDNFEDIQVFRFPDEEGFGGYGTFKQIVILGKYVGRHRYPYSATRELYEKGGTHSYASPSNHLPTVPQGTIIFSPSAKFAGMRRKSYTASEIDTACEADGVYTNANTQMYPTSADFDDPLRPPRVGHIAQMITGGLVGTLAVEDTAFKGMVQKTQVVVEETKGTFKTRDIYTAHVARVSPAGLEHFDTTDLVAAFLREHAATFERHILETFVPYGNHAKPWEEQLLNTLSKDSILPGREEAGLIRDQKDLSISVSRALDRYGVAHLVAEMGYGKTRTALAAIELRDAYPALITCPPHLVVNWQEEAEASVPGCKGIIVETITELEDVIQGYKKGGEVIGKNASPRKWAILNTKWEAKGRPVEMILIGPAGPSRWRLMHLDRLDETPTFVRCGDKLVVIMATSRAKLGPGSEPQFQVAHYLKTKNVGARAKFQDAVALYKDARRSRRAEVKTEVGNLQESITAIQVRQDKLLSEYKKSTIGREEDEIEDLFAEYWECWKNRRDLDDNIQTIRDMIVEVKQAAAAAMRELRQVALSRTEPYPQCPQCGRVRTGAPGKKKRVECGDNTLLTAWNDQEAEWNKVTCHGAMWQNAPTIARRWPLADYIRRQHPHFFKMYVPDEVHKHKAKGTNIGYVLQWLANCCPVITLTGTFFGGAASSIFYLLYRTQANVRKDFGYADEQRWVERYGVLEKTFEKSESEDYSIGTGRRRRQVNSREKPGLSPEAIKYFLPTTCFARVTDLGIKMPAYNEEIVDLGLGQIGNHILNFQQWTWAYMLDNMPRWTSSWLQWNLGRPNSAFRDEKVKLMDDSLISCPAEVEDNELLSKEEWMVDMVKAELAAGRKVIIYPRQTGTRDIRDRLVDVLSWNGVTSVAVLDKKVNPKKRKAWLEKNSKRVLITNPRLVETGMNLHKYGYCTIIFYEIEYSLYTLWQAMSRVWRPGQTKGVKVFFSIYGDTLEGKALAHIGKKMLSGQLLYGDDVTSALVEDTGDAGLVLELIKAIKAEKESGKKVLTISSGDKIFGIDESAIESTSPLGSPTVKSAKMITVADWLMEKHGLTLEEINSKKTARKKKVASGQSQMSLF